jgi:pre-60S factor REI1
MKSKLHTKIRYETGIDLEDLDVFYDFDVTNKDFLETLDDGLTGPPQRRRRRLHELNGDHCSPQDAEEGDAGDEDADEEDGEWEDVTDDEGEDRNTGGDVDIESGSGDDAEDEDEDEGYRGYEDEVRRMGLSVSDLGELVFPDGRTVGHRGLRRYYQQRLAPSRRRELALADSVRSARNAAAERLWKGRVYSVGGNSASSSSAPSSLAAAAAVRQKMHAASLGLHAATGRAGGGILVPTSSSPYDYSRLSVYRYRAAVRKARYGENYGRRLRQRANTNLNRMDKKANRIANGVSVAHAAR